MNGAWQSTLSLLLVLGAAVSLAWVLRRYARPAAGGGSLLRVLCAVGVGPRERVVIVEAGEHWLVLGVAPGRVSALHTLPRREVPAAPVVAAGFADALKRLGSRDG